MTEPAGGLSLVVPCMNEIESLPALARRLAALRETLAPRRLELILVDDGSTDGTGAALERHFDSADDRVLHHAHNRGIAAALATGIAAAREEVIGSLDADLSYDPEILLAMIPRIEAGADLVTASPYHPDGGVDGVPPWRLGLSRAASWLYRRLLRTRLFTYTSCVRCYRAAAVRDLVPRAAGFEGVIELLALLDRRGGRIEEIPARLGPRRAGVSKMRTLRTIRGHVGLMARIATGRLGERHE